jgi:hypothetical protein
MKRTAQRAENQLHQSNHLGAIQGLRTDLGLCLHSTVHDLGNTASLPLTGFSGPTSSLKSSSVLPGAAPDMDEPALLSCVEWVAHGSKLFSPFSPMAVFRR